MKKIDIIYLDRNGAIQTNHRVFASEEEVRADTDGRVLAIISNAKSMFVDHSMVMVAWKAFINRPAPKGQLLSKWGIFSQGTSVEEIITWFARLSPDIWKNLAMDQYKNIQRRYTYYDDINLRCGKRRVKTKDGIYRIAKIGDGFAILFIHTSGRYAVKQEVYCLCKTEEEARAKISEIGKTAKAQNRA